jgi:glyoxylase-like metal-dependent hydrolase (beta-lactamase superfamily II)
LQVVASPGHTPGHISFLDTRDDTLIAGDAYVTRGGVEVAGTRRLLMLPTHLATADRATALVSARTLRELRPSRLAVGHGRLIESPLNAMESAIARAERELAKK